MISRGLLCLSACAMVVVGASVARVDDSRSFDKTNEVEEDSWFAFPNKQINMIQRMFSDCSSDDPFSVCLKAKAVTFLDRVLRKDSIHLMEGLSLVADTNVSRARAGRALTEEELVASLPRELSKKEETLDEMIVNKLTEFFQSHKVKLDFSEDSQVGEGRGKKKYLPILFLGKIIAATHLGFALKGLALLAIKALVIAKVALAIAGVIVTKKLFHGHHGSNHHTYEVLTAEHGDHHDRVYNVDQQAQQLAYRAYVNKKA